MANIAEYIKESYDELKHKVSWPNWEELQSSATVVLVAMIIIAIIILIMDSFSDLMVYQLIYKMFI
ncbi:MAG: preprotein translocase subunit SecE [Bacteroidetes bacterium]|nr:preprotein translocase subunit SecE [Bacteroidota bacterium]